MIVDPIHAPRGPASVDPIHAPRGPRGPSCSTRTVKNCLGDNCPSLLHLLHSPNPTSTELRTAFLAGEMLCPLPAPLRVDLLLLSTTPRDISSISFFIPLPIWHSGIAVIHLFDKRFRDQTNGAFPKTSDTWRRSWAGGRTSWDTYMGRTRINTRYYPSDVPL